MSQQMINVGEAPNDGEGDTLREAGVKINDNFTELYGAVANLLADLPDQYQPLSDDLTAIAQLTTTEFGRSILALANAAALRAAAGLGTVATQDANAVAVTGGAVSGLTSLSAGNFVFTSGGVCDYGESFGNGRITWGAGYAGVQSLNANELRLGVPSSLNALVIDVTGGATFANAVRVSGALRCASLRIEASPASEAPAATHTLTISLNGVPYRMLLAAV